MNEGRYKSRPFTVTPEAAARFLERVDMRSGDECWEWRGYRRSTGYGYLWLSGGGRQAHRAAFVIAGGKLIPGMEIDHLCRNRSCVNPSHLEQVTRLENIRRSKALIPPVTHCLRGHEYTSENTIIDKRSNRSRTCKECKRTRTREYMRRKAAERRFT